MPKALDSIPFVVDLSKGQAICLECRQACEKMTLPRFALFWCKSLQCGNRVELRLYPNGTLKSFPIGAIYGNALVARALRSLVASSLEAEERNGPGSL